MSNAVIDEAAYDQDKAIHLSQLVQQLTGDATFGGTRLKPRDICVGHFGVDRLLRLEHFRESGDARVGHIHNRRMDFEAACRSGGGGMTTRQRIKNGGLS